MPYPIHALALAMGAVAAIPAGTPLAAQQVPSARSLSGTLPGGAKWVAEVPSNWNGTLLLWSRGYSPTAGSPEAATRGMNRQLLDAGYAIAGSDYGAGGWSLAEAVPAQRATIAAFAAAHAKPRRVIAWGYSMGGLVTTALAEQEKPAIHGALAMCASIGGAVGMMNMALDGAYAFRTLVAPDAGIRLVDVDDDRANAGRVNDALKLAMTTPEGRARVTLAGVLGGLPGWTSRDKPEPDASDYEAQADEVGRSFAMGIFLPRTDQEQRAGGVFSWSTGVDYRQQLTLSGRRPMVEALYRKAGLDLDAELARLNAGERVAAKPSAVDYMVRHYTPNAKPRVPLLAVQTIGDGLTSPSLQRGYAEAARGRDVKSVYVRGAGHCTFSPEAVMASIRFLDTRLEHGKWGTAPAMFVPHTPPPMLRPFVRGREVR
ncbi:alpha/beta fold hydrolase [Sphingomonas sp. IC-56]|uniref:alpha/beta fold hydrolase n=1 Tax=Sphingomonas sp. IC-56 TaxID=2898529 RepID=UPI001E5720DB|nr:alpha/beta fold hydrolase [Sphingomonas sp. IC-56]MCD2322873.1 alpha/beta fold hydrolase [Sphingomonas sp. IC-56]